jgi:hypothetical protein
MADFLSSYYEEGFFPTQNVVASIEKDGNQEPQANDHHEDPPLDKFGMSAQSVFFNIAGMNIKEYDGDENHQPLHTFLENIDKLRLTRPNITELELVRLAISKCIGHAYGVVRPISYAIDSLEQLEQVLQLGCGVFDNPEVCELQLINCKQERNESVSGFFRRICNLQQRLERCRENIKENGPEKRKRLEEERAKVLRRGLLPRYRDYVRQTQMKDGNVILKFALEEEMFLPPPDKSPEELVATLMPMLEQRFTLHSQQLLSAIGSDVGQTHQVGTRGAGLSITAVPFLPAANQQQQQGQRQYSNWMQQKNQPGRKQASCEQNMNQKLPTKNLKCYNCDRTGHFKSNCIFPPCCVYCGDTSHNLQNCPSTYCFKCNTFGHMPRTCNTTIS